IYRVAQHTGCAAYADLLSHVYHAIGSSSHKAVDHHQSAIGSTCCITYVRQNHDVIHGIVSNAMCSHKPLNGHDSIRTEHTCGLIEKVVKNGHITGIVHYSV